MSVTKDKGRPSKYRPEFAQQAKKLCMLNIGATDKHLAEFFGVSESTINLWKKQQPEFSESVKGGKMVADAEIAATLYQRAAGFYYNEVTFEKIDSKTVLENTDENTLATDPYKKKIVTKYVVPDTGAIMSWLKNRQPELWRDKTEIDFNKLSDEQIDMMVERLITKANKQQ
jgi:hypothetical protein